MNTATLYRDLTMQGVNLYLDEGALRYRALKGKMTPDVLANIKTHKLEIIELLVTKANHEKTVARIQKNTPYSPSQMQGFLAKYEKPLFYHLVDCMDCDFEAARYCPDILKVGRGYNVMLSYFDDALARREALLTQVIRARISGRSVFLSLDHDHIPTPQQKPVKPLTYGIDDSERPFVNHIMACKQCRPRSALYCADGLKLKANA